MLYAGHWCRWIASLPQHVSTPLEWGPEEVEAVGDPVLRHEVAQMQVCCVLIPVLAVAPWGKATMQHIQSVRTELMLPSYSVTHQP
jgi:hypothetical protein